MCEFRTLKAEEIECRIGTVSKSGNGCSLLLYKDARCDMNILDEAVGCLNWKREHTRNNANCIVSIWDDKKEQWISKEDTGSESNTEPGKGLASDSFKRTCVNWGIGRELYTAPFIWLSNSVCNIEKKGDGKSYTCNDKFVVKEIDYDDKRCICKLVIINEKSKKVVYRFGDGKDNSYPPEEPPKHDVKATEKEIQALKDLCKGYKVSFDKLIVACGLDANNLSSNDIQSLTSSLHHKYGKEKEG